MNSTLGATTQPASAPARPTAQILLQVVRNRLIDYLEVAASFPAQLAFQEQQPELDVPNEIIEQWADWVSPEWKEQFIAPVFSEDELLAVAAFQVIWEAMAHDIVKPLPALSVLIQTPLWDKLRRSADYTFQVFMRRGRLSETQEADV